MIWRKEARKRSWKKRQTEKETQLRTEYLEKLKALREHYLYQIR